MGVHSTDTTLNAINRPKDNHGVLPPEAAKVPKSLATEGETVVTSKWGKDGRGAVVAWA